ncbi:MAG: 4Fe-4S dicluster domain-containing protein [Crenarchaeota archaeon]|nr:4Fe-4S dicluster domain-containing protein [Thermoproteota archaeon]
MPLKTKKIDTANTLTLEWILHIKHYKLVLDKKCCVGCQICSLACPKEAITLIKQPYSQEKTAQKAKVDINLDKCNFCGICDITCPYGAIKVTLNNKHELNVILKESYPELIRDIKVDSSNCPAECTECKTACPLKIISLSKTLQGRPVVDPSFLDSQEKERVKTTFLVQKEYCPTCKVCEVACPSNLIKIRKAYEGSIAIAQVKCPEGCKDCLDVCPITGALSLNESGKVQVNESFCTYCGACKVVCPEQEALTITRTKVLHTPVHSGAWNKALERLTSPVNAGKELKAKGSQKAMESVNRRFVAEEDIK